MILPQPGKPPMNDDARRAASSLPDDLGIFAREWFAQVRADNRREQADFAAWKKNMQVWAGDAERAAASLKRRKVARA
jgi:hypothetical protein